ncbi:peptide chain release factor N(5)-glutamine methyltransferase [Desertivibrio insolitus]|uniref:peptide chain release factor N(5)-glutamine methyltransferase n=1 Tax=Herbiconiux sp. SYSU D00978 TaxID=2812562 RepID=UPI001A972376|nr:peptide chain release factor N(5)-glutamine methyltransferase [Herbiconiux sp. SYSU D00978]
MTTNAAATAVPLSDALQRAAARLARAGVPTPAVDAELLAGHLLGLGRGALQAKAITGATLDAARAEEYERLVDRRAAREPLQHITGVAAFRSLELAVGPGVFVPRPETEHVAQLAIDALRAVPVEHPVAVDLGTGSGAIALALATEVPHASVVAVENSVDAFVWTKQNAQTVGAANLRLVFTDLAEALPELDGGVDVVVSNPPYIPDAAVPRDPEVQRFDPPAALYGGEDGLDVVRAVSRTALRLLRPGGLVVIEHGDSQGPEMAALLRADGWTAVATHQDLTRRDRATTGLAPLR